jgi:hypothetical protein
MGAALAKTGMPIDKIYPRDERHQFMWECNAVATDQVEHFWSHVERQDECDTGRHEDSSIQTSGDAWR